MFARENNLVVIGTLYPGVESYIDDYYDSLRNQTLNKFDILLANDGLRDIKAETRLGEICCRSIKVNGSIAANRRQLIRHVLDMGYRRIIFTDCDDTLEINRVEVANLLLDNADVVVNDLDITDEKGRNKFARYFAPRFDGTSVDGTTIRFGNIMGLSNTAARIEVFENLPALSCGEPIAFDWYLWACVFELGYCAKFTAETSTRYRVYGENIAGMPQKLDEESIAKGIEVKCQHYELMQKISQEFVDLYREFSDLRSRWTERSWRRGYIKRLRASKSDIHMWWENIRTPLEVGMK